MAGKHQKSVCFSLLVLLYALACILWANLAHSGTFTAFGPRIYERGTGSPAPVITPFTIPNPSTSYTLRIYNGGRAGIRTGERVSGAVIRLNGAVIVGPQNFNEKVSEISFPIKVLASNQLSVALRSKPGSLLVVEVIGEDNAAPSLSFTAPKGLVVMDGRALHEIAVQYSDTTSGLDLTSLKILIDGINVNLCQIGPSSATCSLPSLLGGVHTATAEIRDRAGNWARTSHNFEVDNVPVANAGQNINSLTSLPLVLDGSDSFDPDGDSITCHCLPSAGQIQSLELI